MQIEQKISDYKKNKKGISNIIIATTKDELKQAIETKKQEYIMYMQTTNTDKDLEIQEKIQNYKDISTISVGLTPTMGALHNGHKSLIEKNVSQNNISIVSIFVNPTQFAPTEDLSRYPRTLDEDIKLCDSLGVDVVFKPTNEIMYEDIDEITINPPKRMGYILEGYHRPTHFSGVLQVVLKLFNLIMPHNAYFGKKDAQQLIIIKKMVKNLYLPINIIEMPIIRDVDGLALSSRNVYLNSDERKKALAIPKAIFHIESLIKHNNEINTYKLKQEALEILKELEIDYLDFYDTNLRLAEKAKNCVCLLAVRIGKIRLLDNLWIE